MDGKIKAERKKNPREGANPLSILTFAYTLPTFWLGRRRDLEISDLYEPLKEHKSDHLGTKVSKMWQKEYDAYVKRKQLLEEKEDHEKYQGKNRLKEPSLAKVLIKYFGPQVMLYGITFAVLESSLRVLQPLFLGKLLQYYSTNEMTKDEAYLYAGGVILCSALLLVVMHPYMLGMLHIGMKLRIACCSLIYRKALKLSRTALGETTIGQAVNLLSNDVKRFDIALVHVNHLWIGPLQTIIITYFLYNEVQLSALFGVAVLLLFIPLQVYLGKKSSIYRLKTAIRTDERVRLTNEIITGIQAIKMYCWEKPFSNLIERARKKEISVIRSMSMIRGITISFFLFTTRMSLFVTILAYILYGHKITADKVFMLQAYYNILRQTMTGFFPKGITEMAELSVSVKRLHRFMLYEEIDARNTNQKDSRNKETGRNDVKSVEKDTKNMSHEERKTTNSYQRDYVINLKNTSAKWLSYEPEDTLKNINFKLKPGELVAVVGQVGGGKSSLLNLILKELPTATGSIEVNGKLAYASQEPWLFAGSVRQNILFGRPMDQFRYDRVVKMCQLKRDFSLLPYGDKTIVGERGVSLSGGQRARINLARAVYVEADTYLFDDPLSAVDTHVGRYMFEECIVKYLKGKARIIVTHQLQHLRNVDRILVLKDGHIEAEGSYDELSRMGIDFGTLLESPEEEEEEEEEEEKERRAGSDPPSKNNFRNGSVTSLSSSKSTGTEKDEPVEVAETRTTGKVSGKVYRGYFFASGNCCLIFAVTMLMILSQLFGSGSDFFISQWVNMEEKYLKVNEIDSDIKQEWKGPISREACIYLYSALIAFTIVITLIRSVAFFATAMRASKSLHNRMFRSISRATMLFFNTNPSGRILNRFSKDMGAIDELLPMAMIDCMQIGLTLLGVIIVVAIANYWLLIPTVVVGIVFYYLRLFYLATSRSVKRLEGVTRSPVFTHLSATLQGLPTIRAFGAEEILTKEFDQQQDLHSSAFYIFISSSKAFGFWLDVFCVVYICSVTLSFLLLNDGTTGGNVGLAITQSIGLTGIFQWGMRQSTEMENQMTSVERVLEYIDVESEPPLESAPDKKPKETWPEEGKIEFRNVYLRYDPAEAPVLKNLNFVIYPREKIGIVGRTGAGKSSLTAALFRVANIEGTITIDGVNSLEIGLHDLRSKISIIPQEPFLFSGSLRKNLDPFDQYESDAVLWQALEDVELKEMGLEAHITEGGSNLSVGQRQLVCLARAIVKKNPILILDEATANVDPQTDELIQKTIRTKFANCTVLTIAHRLNTVMDSDRILVMDAGNVVEFDAPYLLIQKSGYLDSMIRETGPVMMEALKEVARVSYKSRTSTSL